MLERFLPIVAGDWTELYSGTRREVHHYYSTGTLFISQGISCCCYRSSFVGSGTSYWVLEHIQSFLLPGTAAFSEPSGLGRRLFQGGSPRVILVTSNTPVKPCRKSQSANRK